MKLLSYEVSIKDDKPWDFQRVEFKTVNLLVGPSASGKTRYLNTLFNLGRFAINQNEFKRGKWDIKFEHDNRCFSLFMDAGFDPVTPDVNSGHHIFLRHKPFTHIELSHICSW
jgi:septin family protein